MTGEKNHTLENVGPVFEFLSKKKNSIIRTGRRERKKNYAVGEDSDILSQRKKEREGLV